MREPVFVTTDQVVTYALDRWGARVADRATVDSAVNACRASFDGFEPYPTLWDKAVCLLRALTTTQGFVDGNKRAAWTACELFLALNGVFLEPPEVCATVFVLGLTSHDRVDPGQEPMELIEHALAVEWLQDHAVP